MAKKRKPKQKEDPAIRKKRQYETIKILIEKEHIEKFSDIFLHIPYTVVARDLGKNNNDFSYLKSFPSGLRFTEMQKIAKLIGVDVRVIVELILNQVEDKNPGD